MSANQLCDDAGVFETATHFFAYRDGAFHPTEWALSRWGNDSLNGPAVVGLAARCLENEYGVDGFLPTRLTADLFKAAHRVPTEVRTRLVRDGRRIRGSECDVMQDGVVVARATMVQYRRSAAPPGEEWVAEQSFTPPQGISGAAYAIGSDDVGWNSSGAAHQNASRKRVYHRTIEVVEGETVTPFVRTVVAAEATSMVTNLGSKGIGYINGDLTVALSRLPIGEYVGLQADSHWCNDGISVGTATLFDDQGAFGTGMVTAIANPAAQIDFGAGDIPTSRV
ncbi:acyl-CoA thioesterase domain-containing protein [Mycolicibacterium sp.]|uniref:acyl-CoA thioesterase domain-containing protein n=1 Tax=Mycolicibacterium sp. TaxID=2320850 RepID=UPI0025DB075A|nr:acyl-CoA thioesterase domain-containing protein [Mycolicibacterium sp.]